MTAAQRQIATAHLLARIPAPTGWQIERRYAIGSGGLNTVSARYGAGNWVVVGEELQGLADRRPDADYITLAGRIYADKGYGIA